MQSLKWYKKRLGQMNASEVLWRGKAVMRDVTDRALVTRRQRLQQISALMPSKNGEAFEPGFRVTDIQVGQGPPRAGRTISWRPQ